jgi:hypothetical protein
MTVPPVVSIAPGAVRAAGAAAIVESLHPTALTIQRHVDVVVETHPPAATPVVVATASLQGAVQATGLRVGAAGTRSTPPSADRDADTRRDAVARRLPPPITPAVSPAPRGPVAGAASAPSGGGSPAPMAVVFCAALAAMALLARTLVSAPAFARSVSLVLVVERPG